MVGVPSSLLRLERHTYGRQCWLNYQALYSHIPADDLVEHFKWEPERFKYTPVVWPQASQYSRITATRQSVHLNLIFENWGTEMPCVPAGLRARHSRFPPGWSGW
jgi:hypothetical protein